MSYRLVAASLALFLATLFTAAPAAAQGRGGRRSPATASNPNDPFNESPTSGRIMGTVRTMDGHPVGDAHVEVRDVERGNRSGTVQTDSGGTFALYNISPGTYEVTVSSGVTEGHERVTVSSISRDANVDFRIDLAPSNNNSPKSGDGSTISLSQYKVPPKARALYDKASQLMQHGKNDEALEKVNAAIHAFPKFAEALTLRGLLYDRTGKSPEAIADFQQAIGCDPNYPYAYVTLASALTGGGRIDEALLLLGQAERLAPNLWQIYFERARAHLAKGEFAASLQSADRTAELQAKQKLDTPQVHLVRGYALAGLNELARATQELETFLTREPQGRVADAARQVLSQLREAPVTATR